MFAQLTLMIKFYVLFSVSEREIAAVFEQFLQFSGLSYAKNRLERAWFRDELHKKFQITDDFLMDRSMNCQFQIITYFRPCDSQMLHFRRRIMMQISRIT